MITDAALQAAAKEASLALAETLVQGSKQRSPYSPSKSFTRKMSRLCRRERHPVFHRTMQRVAAVFLALLLTGIGWLTVDAKARAATIAWFRSISQNSIVYRFLNPAPQQTLPDYTPTWLPEGFEEQEHRKDDLRFSGFYTRDEDVIVIDISLYHSGTALSIFCSQEYAEEFELHGYTARYIPADETLFFHYHRYCVHTDDSCICKHRNLDNSDIQNNIISNLKTAKECGYYVPSGSNGVCGYIAAGILLLYYDYHYDDAFIDDAEYLNTSGTKFKGAEFTKLLRSLGATDDTTAYSILSPIQRYLNTRGIDITVTDHLIPTTYVICNRIDANQPVIMFGSWLDVSASNTSYVNHAVLAYGYESSRETMIVHYGWADYSEVHLQGVTGSTFNIASYSL